MKGKDLQFEVLSPSGNRCRVEVPEFRAQEYKGNLQDAAAIAKHGDADNAKRRAYMEQEVFERAVDKALGRGFGEPSAEPKVED